MLYWVTVDNRSGALLIFGKTLKELRESRGMAVSALAREARIERANLSRIEKGTRGVPYISTLAKIADALDLTPNERRLLIEAAITDQVESLLSEWSMYYYGLIAEGVEEDIALPLVEPLFHEFDVRPGHPGEKLDVEIVAALGEIDVYEALRLKFIGRSIARMAFDFVAGVATFSPGREVQTMLEASRSSAEGDQLWNSQIAFSRPVDPPSSEEDEDASFADQIQADVDALREGDTRSKGRRRTDVG
jgi:XRE family transcriptional regulator of biofilm formation